MMANKILILTKKTILFGGAGAIGALVGSLLFEPFDEVFGSGFFTRILRVTIWTGLVSLGISIGLLMAQNFYLKKVLISPELIRTGARGILIGAIAGGIAQFIFAFAQNSAEIISRVICWGIFGSGAGWGISLFVPNYPRKTAMMAGFIGGLMGGILFRSTFFLPHIIGRTLGVAILGFCIGIMISIIEELFREAWLTVEWNPSDKVQIGLGTQPILLGSADEAHIYLPKELFPAIAAAIQIENGKILFKDHIKGNVTELRKGSRFQVNGITITVQTQ